MYICGSGISWYMGIILKLMYKSYALNPLSVVIMEERTNFLPHFLRHFHQILFESRNRNHSQIMFLQQNCNKILNLIKKLLNFDILTFMLKLNKFFYITDEMIKTFNIQINFDNSKTQSK